MIEQQGEGLKFVTHDILTCGAQYIAHQCNCTSRTARGLAASIFAKYPHTDTYSFPRGKKCRVPGTIETFEPATDTDPGVINCYAQCRPGRHDPPAKQGKGNDHGGKLDTAAKRVDWFTKCLEEITKIPGIILLAFGQYRHRAMVVGLEALVCVKGLRGWPLAGRWPADFQDSWGSC